MTMMKFLGLGRRQLHTIISRETIKPSSPTVSNLSTYNLSPTDQLVGHRYIPLIFFYPYNGKCRLSAHDRSQKMKKSLSLSLTPYYPMAGTLHTPQTPYIDCNDQGVIFVEAKNDSHMKIFQHISKQDSTLEHLFPDGMVWNNSPHGTNIVGVQLNHFACGGMAVAVSMSHIVGDGCTLGSFVNFWASVARYGSTDHKELLSLKPHYIHSQRTNSLPPDAQVFNIAHTNHVMRTFVFPNTKLNLLKNKVNPIEASGSTPHINNNPTRVEVLTSLLYKTAVAAATKKSNCFKPSYLIMPVDLRSKLIDKLPQTSVGNILSAMMIRTRHPTETSLSVMVAEIKKQKSQLECIQSVQQAADNYQKLQLKMVNEDSDDVAKRSYWCTSLCGFPYNKVDFGWGKPIDVTLALAESARLCFMLKDTPDGDGIEALVILEEEDMEIFQNDKEMLSFC